MTSDSGLTAAVWTALDRYALRIESKIEGRAGDQIVRCRSRSGHIFYLKAAQGPQAAELRAEGKRLTWLRGRLPCPEVADCGELDDDVYFLLLHALNGHPAHISEMPEQLIVDRLAAALHKVHAVPIVDCPFTCSLDQDLADARRNCNTQAHVRPEAPAQWMNLVARRGLVRETHFTHGDACLPNFLLQGDRLTGVLDLAAASVGDIHRDLAAAQRSVELNFGVDWGNQLLVAYGSSLVDRNRLAFYAELTRLMSARSMILGRHLRA